MLSRNAIALDPRPRSMDADTTKGGNPIRGGVSDYLAVTTHGTMMHLASSSRKCLLHHSRSYAWRMATANERLREIRLKRGFHTQREAAAFLAVKETTYNQHENDVRNTGKIPRDAAQHYARKFNVTLDWLLTGRGDGPTDQPEPSADELAAMIENALREVPVGVTIGDLPRYVAPSLRDQLERFRADREAVVKEARASAPGTGAQPRDATKRGVVA